MHSVSTCQAFEFAGPELRADPEARWNAGNAARVRNGSMDRWIDGLRQVIRLAARQLLSTNGLQVSNEEPVPQDRRFSDSDERDAIGDFTLKPVGKDV